MEDSRRHQCATTIYQAESELNSLVPFRKMLPHGILKACGTQIFKILAKMGPIIEIMTASGNNHYTGMCNSLKFKFL